MSTALWLGLATGILFGFLLQKGRVLRFEKQIGAILLQDMTIVKFMLSAIIVGMIGLYILSAAGVIAFSHKSMNIGGILIGGSLFGAGWAIAGYCPGTSVGAVGEGRWHALFVILGMLAGAAIFAHIFPYLKETILSWKDYGKIGLPETTGIPAVILIILFSACSLLLFRLFKRKGI